MPAAAKTHEEYIASLPKEVRSLAQQLRRLVHQSAPGATETIKYGIPAFLVEGTPFIYFAVWKKHVGLYPIYECPPALEEMIRSYRHGKDTVRFLLSEAIDEELFTSLVLFKYERVLETKTMQ